jgi:uncharacterized protein YndB with AHSA1/START domain
MTVTNVQKDPENLTLTITSQFSASVDEVWQLWDDPRLLEQWWGPPGCPATVLEHDLRAGGALRYHMTLPDGERPDGWWRVIGVDAPHHLEFENGVGERPPTSGTSAMTIRVAIVPLDDSHTEMTIMTTYESLGAMTEFVEMGMAEGMSAAVGQIDVLLDQVRASSKHPAAEAGT